MIVSHYYLSTENATSDEVSGSVWELLLLFSFFSFCLFFVCLFVCFLFSGNHSDFGHFCGLISTEIITATANLYCLQNVISQ